VTLLRVSNVKNQWRQRSVGKELGKRKICKGMEAVVNIERSQIIHAYAVGGWKTMDAQSEGWRGGGRLVLG